VFCSYPPLISDQVISLAQSVYALINAITVYSRTPESGTDFPGPVRVPLSGSILYIKAKILDHTD